MSDWKYDLRTMYEEFYSGPHALEQNDTTIPALLADSDKRLLMAGFMMFEGAPWSIDLSADPPLLYMGFFQIRGIKVPDGELKDVVMAEFMMRRMALK